MCQALDPSGQIEVPVHRFMVFMRRWSDTGPQKEGKRAAKGASEALNGLFLGFRGLENASRRRKHHQTPQKKKKKNRNLQEI